MGGTGLINDQQEVVQVEQPALNGFTLMTNRPLDIRERGFIYYLMSVPVMCLEQLKIRKKRDHI